LVPRISGPQDVQAVSPHWTHRQIGISKRRIQVRRTIGTVIGSSNDPESAGGGARPFPAFGRNAHPVTVIGYGCGKIQGIDRSGVYGCGFHSATASIAVQAGPHRLPAQNLVVG